MTYVHRELYIGAVKKFKYMIIDILHDLLGKRKCCHLYTTKCNILKKIIIDLNINLFGMTYDNYEMILDKSNVILKYIDELFFIKHARNEKIVTATKQFVLNFRLMKKTIKLKIVNDIVKQRNDQIIIMRDTIKRYENNKC